MFEISLNFLVLEVNDKYIHKYSKDRVKGANMPQLSLYLDESTMEALRQDAARAGTSLSKYVANVLHEHAESSRWPDGFFDLYGSFDDGCIEDECFGDDCFETPFGAAPEEAFDEAKPGSPSNLRE